MVVNGLGLFGAQGGALQGQIVLQLGHGNVHAERCFAQGLHLGLGPGERFTRHQHGDDGHQHAVGGAVKAHLFGRELHQGQQGRVGIVGAVIGQGRKHAVKARQKGFWIGVAHQLRPVQLPIFPARVAGVFFFVVVVFGRGLQRGLGNVAQLFIAVQQGLQLGQIGAVGIF